MPAFNESQLEQAFVELFKKEGYDYIFYQDPYNEHMPPTLRSDNVVRFAKICYVPYGFVGSNDLSHIVTNKAFFRNVTYGFFMLFYLLCILYIVI
mgnify:CR=1 FL=1